MYDLIREKSQKVYIFKFIYIFKQTNYTLSQTIKRAFI